MAEDLFIIIIVDSSIYDSKVLLINIQYPSFKINKINQTLNHTLNPVGDQGTKWTDLELFI